MGNWVQSQIQIKTANAAEVKQLPYRRLSCGWQCAKDTWGSLDGCCCLASMAGRHDCWTQTAKPRHLIGRLLCVCVCVCLSASFVSCHRHTTGSPANSTLGQLRWVACFHLHAGSSTSQQHILAADPGSFRAAARPPAVLLPVHCIPPWGGADTQHWMRPGYPALNACPHGRARPAALPAADAVGQHHGREHHGNEEAGALPVAHLFDGAVHSRQVPLPC